MANPESTADQVYDVIVIGGGAIGENAADRASRHGLSVVVVEHALVGGECSYWACMPSKALLRPGAVLDAARAVGGVDTSGARIDVSATLARRDGFTSHWDDSSQVTWLMNAGLELIRGHARFTGPQELRITPDDGAPFRLSARRAVVVATGSRARVPAIPGLSDVGFWTSKEATSAQRIPARLAIIGGGVVTAEMATAYSALGSTVTLIVRGGRLLTGFEPFAGEAVTDALLASGVRIEFGTEVVGASRDEDGVHLTLSSGSVIDADDVLVAAGRIPATSDLGLETIGLTPGEPIAVNDALEAIAADGGWLFAAGDVTDRSTTTHQGKYDARVVGDVIAARFGPEELKAREQGALAWSQFRASADDEASTQVVFSRPEVAAVGLTEQQAITAGYPVRTVSCKIGGVAGASIMRDGYEGTAHLVLDAEQDVILGATFVGPDVAELLHAATIAVVGQVPLHRLWHATPSYPTVSEIWLHLLETAGL